MQDGRGPEAVLSERRRSNSAVVWLCLDDYDGGFDGTATEDGYLAVDDFHPAETGTNTTVVLETPADARAATVNATVETTDADTTVEIPVVVGRQLATPEDESQSALDRRTAPRFNTLVAG